jgi:hypothetical protein
MLTAGQQNELKKELSKFITLSLYPDDEDIQEEYGSDVEYLLRDLQGRANKIFDKYFPEKSDEENEEHVKARAMERLHGYANGKYQFTREDLQDWMTDAGLTEFNCGGFTIKIP